MVNEFIKTGPFELMSVEGFYIPDIDFEDYTEDEKIMMINQECKKYAINEDILNNIKIGDYYLLFHAEHDEVNWVIRCHNIISA